MLAGRRVQQISDLILTLLPKQTVEWKFTNTWLSWLNMELYKCCSSTNWIIEESQNKQYKLRNF